MGGSPCCLGSYRPRTIVLARNVRHTVPLESMAGAEKSYFGAGSLACFSFSFSFSSLATKPDLSRPRGQRVVNYTRVLNSDSLGQRLPSLLPDLLLLGLPLLLFLLLLLLLGLPDLLGRKPGPDLGPADRPELIVLLPLCGFSLPFLAPLQKCLPGFRLIHELPRLLVDRASLVGPREATGQVERDDALLGRLLVGHRYLLLDGVFVEHPAERASA